MAKPRIKLKPAAGRKAPMPNTEQEAAHVLAKLGQALNMSVDEIKQDPYKARARREALERVHAGGQPRVEDACWMFPKAVTQIMIRAERQRAMAILKAGQVTGQGRHVAKLVENGLTEEEASAYLFDVAAAASDGYGINNAHSPEGGHRAGINYTKIYDRQNRKKGGVA